MNFKSENKQRLKPSREKHASSGIRKVKMIFLKTA
jgi:hypothetical protein